MEVIIQSPHLTLSQELNNFVADKVNRLAHFYEKIESANVSLKLNKDDRSFSKVCEIRLILPGNDLFAKRQCKTFEEATNQVIDALRQQIKRFKD